MEKKVIQQTIIVCCLFFYVLQLPSTLWVYSFCLKDGEQALHQYLWVSSMYTALS